MEVLRHEHDKEKRLSKGCRSYAGRHDVGNLRTFGDYGEVFIFERRYRSYERRVKRMTEHNDIQETPKPLEPRKSGKLLRLGASCLVLLMFIALLLVGGSFSKNTSEGEISVSTDLAAALFEVEVADGDYNSYDYYNGDEFQRAISSFTVTNNSDVDVTYTMELNISIDFGDDSEYLTG